MIRVCKWSVGYVGGFVGSDVVNAGGVRGKQNVLCAWREADDLCDGAENSFQAPISVLVRENGRRAARDAITAVGR